MIGKQVEADKYREELREQLEGLEKEENEVDARIAKDEKTEREFLVMLEIIEELNSKKGAHSHSHV